MDSQELPLYAHRKGTELETADTSGAPGGMTSLRVLFEKVEGVPLLDFVMAVEKADGDVDGALRDYHGQFLLLSFVDCIMDLIQPISRSARLPSREWHHC